MAVTFVDAPEVIRAWHSVHLANVSASQLFDGDESESDTPKTPLNGYCDPWSPSLHATDMDEIGEIAGRICYQSFTNPRPGGNESYIKRILEAGHGNVLEHASVGFVIRGVSRSLTHELIRHRVGVAVSELSQRYVDASDLRFVVPPLYAHNPPISFTRLCERAAFEYKCLSESAVDAETTTERKRIREAARSVLPNCVETHIAITANLRAWRNIIEQRGSIYADLEIRRLAVAILPHLKSIASNTFQDTDVVVMEDSMTGIRSEHRKV